jgi:hypothetical protein
LKCIARNAYKSAAAAICKTDRLKEYVFIEVVQQMMEEVVHFAKQPDCLLKATSPEAVKTFSNTVFFDYLLVHCPKLVSILFSICNSGNAKNISKSLITGIRNSKVDEGTRNMICNVSAMCMRIYNQQLSALHYRNGLLLLHGGVKSLTLQRCFYLGLCVSHKSCIRMQKKFGC